MCSCGRGDIFTGDKAKFNGKIDGESRCPQCIVEHTYEQFINQTRND